MAISNGVEPFRRSTALRSAPLWISNFASFVRLLDETAKCNAVRPRGTNVTENEKKHQNKKSNQKNFNALQLPFSSLAFTFAPFSMSICAIFSKPTNGLIRMKMTHQDFF